MSSVRRYTRPNRLTHFVNTPDGLTVAEAIARADANVAEMKPPSLEHIDALLAGLGTRPPAAPAPSEVERMYRAAVELAGICGLFGLAAMGKAAYSLCELLDLLRSTATWTPAAVGVHLDGLRLLRQEDAGGLTPEAAATVLAGLDQVVQRVADTASA